MNSSQEEIQASFTLAEKGGRKKKKFPDCLISQNIPTRLSWVNAASRTIDSCIQKQGKRAGPIRFTPTKVITVSSKLKGDNPKWLQCSVLPHLYFSSELLSLYTVTKVLGHMDCMISVLSATSRCLWLKYFKLLTLNHLSVKQSITLWWSWNYKICRLGIWNVKDNIIYEMFWQVTKYNSL